MTRSIALRIVLATALLAGGAARAQVPVLPASDQEALLASADATLAANKRLAFDFWREVLEAGHLELAGR